MLPFQTNSVGLQDAIQSQDAIGWDNFFEGCLAKDWEQAQDAYYKWYRSRKSARRWTIALIRSYGTWHGICGSTVMASFTLPRPLRYSMAWQRQTTQFDPKGLQQRDHGLFTGPVNGILAASIVYRQRWLQRVQTARAQASRRPAEAYSGERRALRAWPQGGIQGGYGGHEN
jgi:hypothetical protein